MAEMHDLKVQKYVDELSIHS